MLKFQGGLVDIPEEKWYPFFSKGGDRMSLGETICRLRTGKNMSQGDLGAALDVSRQSISKWETDASVPELDKLVKMSELFGVTLDELVTGKKPEAPEPKTVVVERQGVPVRKAVGIILLCMAFAAAVLFAVVGRLLEGLVVCLPFLICGLICVKAEKHPGLWCLWALYLMADGFLRWGTGLSWATVRWTLYWEESWNYTRLAIAWCQFLCGLGLMAGTAVKLGKKPMEWTSRNRRLFLGGTAVFLLLCLPFSTWIFQAGGLPVSGLVGFVSWLQDSMRLGLLAALGTMLLRGRKR